MKRLPPDFDLQWGGGYPFPDPKKNEEPGARRALREKKGKEALKRQSPLRLCF
jgi:hypothetical protein